MCRQGSNRDCYLALGERCSPTLPHLPSASHAQWFGRLRTRLVAATILEERRVVFSGLPPISVLQQAACEQFDWAACSVRDLETMQDLTTDDELDGAVAEWEQQQQARRADKIEATLEAIRSNLASDVLDAQATYCTSHHATARRSTPHHRTARRSTPHHPAAAHRAASNRTTTLPHHHRTILAAASKHTEHHTIHHMTHHMTHH